MSAHFELSTVGRMPAAPPLSSEAEKRINDAVRALRKSAESACNAAVELNTIIIIERKALASEGSLLRSTAELLHHMTQLFARIADPNTATPDKHENS